MVGIDSAVISQAPANGIMKRITMDYQKIEINLNNFRTKSKEYEKQDTNCGRIPRASRAIEMEPSSKCPAGCPKVCVPW